jgi:hypothetical protein
MTSDALAVLRNRAQLDDKSLDARVVERLRGSEAEKVKRLMAALPFHDVSTLMSRMSEAIEALASLRESIYLLELQQLSRESTTDAMPAAVEAQASLRTVAAQADWAQANLSGDFDPGQIRKVLDAEAKIREILEACQVTADHPLNFADRIRASEDVYLHSLLHIIAAGLAVRATLSVNFGIEADDIFALVTAPFSDSGVTGIVHRLRSWLFGLRLEFSEKVVNEKPLVRYVHLAAQSPVTASGIKTLHGPEPLKLTMDPLSLFPDANGRHFRLLGISACLVFGEHIESGVFLEKVRPIRRSCSTRISLTVEERSYDLPSGLGKFIFPAQTIELDGAKCWGCGDPPLEEFVTLRTSEGIEHYPLVAGRQSLAIVIDGDVRLPMGVVKRNALRQFAEPANGISFDFKFTDIIVGIAAAIV